jgi:hypothetical protein
MVVSEVRDPERVLYMCESERVSEASCSVAAGGSGMGQVGMCEEAERS